MGVLFCVSVHLKIDPFVSTYKKPRFWRDREQRQGWGSKHLSHSFLDLLSRPWPPCHFSYAHYCHYPCSMDTRMPSDDGQWLCRERREGFLTAWNPGHRGKTAVKFAAKPGQVELHTTQMPLPPPPDHTDASKAGWPWRSYWHMLLWGGMTEVCNHDVIQADVMFSTICLVMVSANVAWNWYRLTSIFKIATLKPELPVLLPYCRWQRQFR